MDPVQRPNQPETFTHLEKITSNYQFVASKKGVVHSRQRPCWCLPCFTAVTDSNSVLSWPLEYSPLHGSSVSITKAIFTFTKRSCEKLTGLNVQQFISKKFENQKEMAKQLRVGDWIMVGGGDNADQPVWL